MSLTHDSLEQLLQDQLELPRDMVANTRALIGNRYFAMDFANILSLSVRFTFQELHALAADDPPLDPLADDRPSFGAG